MAAPGSATVDNLDPSLKRAALAVVEASNGRVSIVSGWRSRAQQEALYKRNCGSLDADPSKCRPATARPGTSQHELGRAVDFGGDLELAAQLAPRFQLVLTVPGESWHYELSGNRARLPSGFGDTPTLPTDPLNPIGGVLDAGRTIADVLGKLTDTHLWLRVAMVAGGLALCALGLILLGMDLKQLGAGPVTNNPASAAVKDAAGAGKALG